MSDGSAGSKASLSGDTFIGIALGLAGIGGAVFDLDWLSRSLLVLFAVCLTIYAARRHAAHPIWRTIGAVAVILLFGGLSWRPIWKDFSNKHPGFADTITLRSATQGPRLEAKIEGTILGQSMIDNRMTPGLLIIASITNIGTVQTIARNYHVSVAKNGNVYQGTVLGAPHSFKMVPFLPEDKSGPTEYFEEDTLYNKTSTPIPPGGSVYGFLIVSLPTVSDFKALIGGVQIYVTFEDAFSNRFFDIAIPDPTQITTDFRSIMRVYPGMHTKFPPK